MPRTAIASQRPKGSYPSLPITANAADLAWTAADDVNLNSTPHTGKLLILARNDDVGAQTVTVTSKADEKRRTGDITAYSLGAGEYGVFGPFKNPGWRQDDGSLYYEASDAGVFFAVLDVS